MFKPYYLPTIIFAAVTTVILQSQPSIALSSEQISEIAEQITVRILTPGSPGSGIIIGKNGNTYKVLTARHVIESIKPGEESDVQTFDEELHYINTDNMQTFGDNWDLAVVEFTSDQSYQVGEFGDSSSLKRGQTVYVAGFPIATAAMNIPILTFTEGKLTAVASRPFDDGYGLVYDNSTLPGMSGGVVLDKNGKIVGVHGRADADNTKATDDPTIRIKTGFNLAIPINFYLGLTNQIAFNLNANTALTADDYLIQANQKYKQKDYQGAIYLYNQAIEINPQYAFAYNDRGTTYDALQKYPEAIADYNKAIQLNPQDAVAYNNLGIAYHKLQKYPEAIADYNKAIQLNPQYAQAYYNRGNIYYDLQKYPEAIADYTKAIELNPRYINAYFNRGTAYGFLKKYPEAIADYTQAIKLNPEHARAYANMGLAKLDLGENQSGRKDLQTAAELWRQQGDMAAYQQIMLILQILQQQL